MCCAVVLLGEIGAAQVVSALPSGCRVPVQPTGSARKPSPSPPVGGPAAPEAARGRMDNLPEGAEMAHLSLIEAPGAFRGQVSAQTSTNFPPRAKPETWKRRLMVTK